MWSTLSFFMRTRQPHVSGGKNDHFTCFDGLEEKCEHGAWDHFALVQGIVQKRHAAEDVPPYASGTTDIAHYANKRGHSVQ